MKKLVLALLAVGSVATANAQKNSILVYGTAGIFVDQTDFGTGAGESKTTAWNVNPGVGYQFHKNLTAGIQGGYMKNTVEDRDLSSGVLIDATAESREWQAGAFFRHTYYLSNIFAVFHQINLSYVNGRIGNEVITPGIPVATTEDFYSGFEGVLFPSVMVNVHDGMALNFGFGGIGYRTVSFDKGLLAKESSQFFVTMGNQFNVGITKNFGCGKKTKYRHKPMDETRRLNVPDEDEDEDDEKPSKRKRYSDDDE